MFERKGLTTQEQIDDMKRELQEPDAFDQVTRFIEEKRIKRKRRGPAIVRNLSFLLVLALMLHVLGNVYLLKQRGEIPHVFGFYVFSIETASMEPTLDVGSLIFSRKPADNSDIKIGTVVTFTDLEGRVVTHRIIDTGFDEKGNPGYVTKGDNPINSPDDQVLTPDRIIAVFLLKLPFT